MSRKVSKRPATRRFDRAPQANIPRSTFDLSFPYKNTIDSAGLLVTLPPIEVLPGDSFRLRMFALARLATPLHPTMDNSRLSSFWFFVPNRLTWNNWQKFMGEQDKPGASTDFTIPRTNTQNWSVGETGDHMGLPIGKSIQTSALPFRAAALCWNEWFRDQNLQDSLVVPTDDGPDIIDNYYKQPQRRGKRKDYLSSALPWPQKGPASEIPLGATAPITTTAAASTGSLTFEAPNEPAGFAVINTSGSIGLSQNASGPTNLFADLSQATGATINDWREAFQIQKLKERDARGGTRYVEIVQAHFQVFTGDARVNRPEYLGGGITPITMRSVPQTSQTDATVTPQGNLTAYAEGHVGGHGFTKSFVEHGYIIGFISIQADLNYQQKLDRHWSRQTKYDFYWPALQALGEQPIYNKEIWYNNDANDDAVWGYQERWAEYRSLLGHICGKFRSAATGTLDPWHYALDFQTRPALDNVFIEDTPPVKRTVAVQDEPEYLLDAWVDIKAARPMPVYSVPGYIDHF